MHKSLLMVIRSFAGGAVIAFVCFQVFPKSILILDLYPSATILLIGILLAFVLETNLIHKIKYIYALAFTIITYAIPLGLVIGNYYAESDVLSVLLIITSGIILYNSCGEVIPAEKGNKETTVIAAVTGFAITVLFIC